ncbi:unnamed protein product [Trichogramma brassicae]|uniref:Sodium/potassium-transporting ATPase subunit beta-1-interacting protein n=1 Tax=Trichogramma brassicae TaxID=86971 RepID=A0A6H5HWS1_9HYME|nr:unnamed protein product [Trichogramma brassicae]
MGLCNKRHFLLTVCTLQLDSDLLNFGTNSFSWWYVNGPGCKAHYNNTLPEVDRPDVVTDCVLNYEIVEVIHSSIQCLLAVMAIIGGIILSRVFMEEDDSCK